MVRGDCLNYKKAVYLANLPNEVFANTLFNTGAPISPKWNLIFQNVGRKSKISTRIET